ncbi:MAG: hypothetical protein ABL927_13795, partial [Bdellovibrionales bacterium]
MFLHNQFYVIKNIVSIFLLTLFIGTLEAADTSTEKYDESSTVAEVANIEQPSTHTTKLRSMNTNVLPAKRAEAIL